MSNINVVLTADAVSVELVVAFATYSEAEKFCNKEFGNPRGGYWRTDIPDEYVYIDSVEFNGTVNASVL